MYYQTGPLANVNGVDSDLRSSSDLLVGFGPRCARKGCGAPGMERKGIAKQADYFRIAGFLLTLSAFTTIFC
jgi:hypothetical protein